MGSHMFPGCFGFSGSCFRSTCLGLLAYGMFFVRGFWFLVFG